MSRETDGKLKELVEAEFAGFDFKHAMVLPSLDATFRDNAKYGMDFTRTHSLDADFALKTEKLLISLLSPAFAGKPDGCRLLPLHVAVSHMDKNAGPGYPYSYFGATKGEVITNPDLDFELITRKVVDGELIPIVAINAKEEVREIEKLEADNVRTFTVAPIDMNLVGIQGLYEFCECITKAWRFIPITVGMNPYQGGWHHLVSRFRWNTVSSDHPKFDGCVNPQILRLVERIIKRFCHEECHPYIKTVIDWIIDHPALFGNGLGCWQFGGMPSGAPATIFFNSLVLLTQIIYFIVDHFSGDITADSIKEHLDLAVHGDDSVHAVDPAWSWFTCEKMNDLWCTRLGWNMAFVPYHEEPVPPERFRYLSHLTTKLNRKWVPMHESQSKVLTSIVFGASDEPPDGWSKAAYHLSRMVQIVNTCFPDRHFWSRLKNVEEKYIKFHSRIHSDEDEWQQALSMRRSAADLELWFTEGATAKRESLPPSVFEKVNGFAIVGPLNFWSDGNNEMPPKKKKASKTVSKAALKSAVKQVLKHEEKKESQPSKRKRKKKRAKKGKLSSMQMGNPGTSLAVSSLARFKRVPWHPIRKNTFAGAEICAQVYAPSNVGNFYTVASLPIKPSTVLLWPRCANEAANFNKYRVKSKFYFVNGSTALTNTQLVITFVPDPALPVPSSVIQCQEYECSNVFSVKGNGMLDATQHKNFISDYLVQTSTSDPRLSSPGTVYIQLLGIDAVSAGMMMGMVYHCYEIEFFDNINPTAASIEFNPTNLSLTMPEIKTSAVTNLCSYPVGLPLLADEPTIFSSLNWTSGDTYIARFWQSTVNGAVFVFPSGANNNVTYSLTNFNEIASSYSGMACGSVFFLDPGDTLVVSGHVTCVIQYPTCSGTTFGGLKMFYQTLTETQTPSTNSFDLTAFTAGSTTSVSINQNVNGYLVNSGSQSFRCWIGLQVNGSSAGQSIVAGVHSLSFSSPSNIIFIKHRGGVPTHLKRTVVSQNCYDLQSQASLWMSLYESGAQGQVYVDVEEEKKVEEVEDFESAIVDLRKQLAELKKATIREDRALPPPQIESDAESDSGVVVKRKDLLSPRGPRPPLIRTNSEEKRRGVSDR